MTELHGQVPPDLTKSIEAISRDERRAEYSEWQFQDLIERIIELEDRTEGEARNQ